MTGKTFFFDNGNEKLTNEETLAAIHRAKEIYSSKLNEITEKYGGFRGYLLKLIQDLDSGFINVSEEFHKLVSETPYEDLEGLLNLTIEDVFDLPIHLERNAVDVHYSEMREEHTNALDKSMSNLIILITEKEATKSQVICALDDFEVFGAQGHVMFTGRFSL